GDQGISGMSAVVMVILNRMNSSAFPNDLRTVVYQRKQFEPARTGVLTKYLKNLNSIPNPYLSNTRTAVR
ncbi:cell wall hydrolase, partial [Clostridium butyricum]|nr:cell wall hydrolase [Clostridium butyricum]